MPCEPCRTPNGWEKGKIDQCPECGRLRWLPDDGKQLYPVPGFKPGQRSISEVSNRDFSVVKDLVKPKRLRLPHSIRYYRGKDKKKRKMSEDRSQMEIIFGMTERPKKKRKEPWKSILKHCNSYAEKYGLELTQLLPNSEVKHSEPLLLHWKGNNPFYSFPEISNCADHTPQITPGEDPNWDIYNLDLNQMGNWYGNPFKPEQRNAIDSVLRNEGSLQIVALPTGYGKTRIVQTVTRVLRHHEKGPTLMISPLVALRDDQREDFEKEVNKPFDHFGDGGMESRFITSSEEDHFSIRRELITDKLDLLCCAPEQILFPSTSSSWFEAFHRMEKPFSTLVVDEAHLIGDWGSSIRPQFLLIEMLKDRLIEMNPKLRVVLQSATITKSEEKELRSMIGTVTYLRE